MASKVIWYVELVEKKHRGTLGVVEVVQGYDEEPHSSYTLWLVVVLATGWRRDNATRQQLHYRVPGGDDGVEVK
ncbi:hypothetical protein GOP47_0012106 [Adiantum capillus-veneris]|uniref:Uncharacterized protein n=1 Tax=Adiantum capillus-veneris TaxID=13818 RepID=A0A9D4UQ28_ADICA|nr:hypothetical protein GOP47_0012106 [Adiantum capillus-veneris]